MIPAMSVTAAVVAADMGFSAVLMIVVGFIGNKIVDKGSDVIRNKTVRKKNFENPSEPEKLADRFEKGRKS